MEVNKLESREVFVLFFGGTFMLTLVILSSIGVGHYVTTKSNVPTEVRVTPATPAVAIITPDPKVNLTLPKPEVTVGSPVINMNVPSAPAPTINVPTPPALIALLNRLNHESNVSPLSPLPLPEKGKEPLPAVKPQPISLPPIENAKAADPQPLPVTTSPAETRTEAPPVEKSQAKELPTLDDLYSEAERYVTAYCVMKGQDPKRESSEWQRKWLAAVEQSSQDNGGGTEQSYINRVVVDKRGCFDMDKATPDQIVEGCRIMLRYRDGNLAWLDAMKEKLTNDNLKKTYTFLAAGPQKR